MSGNAKSGRGTRPFTPDEDELIRAMKRGGAYNLALQLGRTEDAIRNRRYYITNGPETQPMHKRLATSQPLPFSLASRFARPDFFDEDLTKMVVRNPNVASRPN